MEMGINMLLWKEWGKDYTVFSIINPGLEMEKRKWEEKTEE